MVALSDGVFIDEGVFGSVGFRATLVYWGVEYEVSTVHYLSHTRRVIQADVLSLHIFQSLTFYYDQHMMPWAADSNGRVNHCQNIETSELEILELTIAYNWAK